jgi:hypothetical protein
MLLKSEEEYRAALGYAQKMLRLSGNPRPATEDLPDYYRGTALMHLRRALKYAAHNKQKKRQMACLRAIKHVKEARRAA